ncbi:MAG: acyl-CoA dehydrogenase family protein [Bacillaceae bacterium]
MFLLNANQQEWIEEINKIEADLREHGEKESEFPYENIELLKKIGYTKFTLPKEFGGQEASLYDFLLCQEAIAKGDGPTALSIGWHVGIMQELVENRRWDDTLFKWMCTQVADGALLNRAASEKNTGSPTRGGMPETTAILEGDEWVISGRKIFTTLSPVLDYFLVSATILDRNEIGDFLVPRNTVGLSIEETWDSVAMSTTGSHDIVLHNVRIPKNYFVENITQTRKNQPKTNGWLLHIPACYLGIATAARDYAVEFAKNYKPNSIQGAICTLPNVKALIGEMELLIYSARTTLYNTARAYDDSNDKAKLAPQLGAAKHIVTNHALEIVDKAMRIVGLRGLSQSSPLHRYYLNVRAGLHNPPMDDSVITLLATKAITE